MNRSLSTPAFRALVGVLGALLLGVATLGVVLPPAQGDTNESGTASGPADRQRQGTISAGTRHTCAVLGVSGSVWCWGDNAAGQLGTGTTAPYATPVKVNGLSGVTAVSAGGNHTCALVQGGAARCWGGNDAGQLGTGNVTPSFTPTAPNGAHQFTSISAGDGYTCGTTPSQVLCWGVNNVGQLGSGGGVSITYPVPVNVPGTPVAVSAGRQHTCATVQGGTAYCWGSNTWGQLGRGFTSGPIGPGAVTGAGFDAITAGDNHTCAITGGLTRCWGNNDGGQLGNGFAGSQASPVLIGNGSTGQAVSAGARHTCGRRDQEVRCWGSDSDGQLGNGPGGSSSVPIQVDYTEGDSPSVTTGASHTCVRRVQGQVECFGDNANGQIGDGTTVDAPSPVRVIDFAGAPTDLSTALGYGSVTLKWKRPANTGGIPLSGYQISDAENTVGITVPADLTSYTLTGLNPGQTYTLRIAALSDLGRGATATAAPVTTPTKPVIAVSDVSYAEGNSGTKNMTFTLTRTGPTTSPSSVKVATQNGTAVASGDYTARAATTISFAAGQATKTFVVSTRGDLLTEDDESFGVVLSSPVGAEVYDTTGIGTLVNDDPGEKPTYGFLNPAHVVEGNSTKYMTFTIVRYGSTAVAGSVQYYTQALGGEASPTTDYTTKPVTTMSFPVGVTTKTFTVAIKGDYVAEGIEFFQVLLKNPVAGDLEPFPVAYGSIGDDDPSAAPTIAIDDLSVEEGDGYSKNVTFTVTRSGNLAGTTAFKFQTQNGTAVAPEDYTARALTSLSFTPGQTVKTIVVAVRGGVVPEQAEQFRVLLSAVTGGSISDGTGIGTILDDD